MVVMTAAAQNGWVLGVAADELRGDKEIMEAALAELSVRELAAVGLKDRLNPACLLSSKKGGKTQQHPPHLGLCTYSALFPRGRGRLSKFCLFAQALKQTLLETFS